MKQRCGANIILSIENLNLAMEILEAEHIFYRKDELRMLINKSFLSLLKSNIKKSKNYALKGLVDTINQYCHDCDKERKTLIMNLCFNVFVNTPSLKKAFLQGSSFNKIIISSDTKEFEKMLERQSKKEALK